MRSPYLSVVGIVTLLTLAPPFAQAAIPDNTGTAFKPNLSTRSLPIPGGTPKQGRAYREACAREPWCLPRPKGGRVAARDEQ
jgi:hypothetical protein